jgi:dihydropteroate synthase
LQKILDFPSYTTPLVMGVVNITPDSFSDGGLYASTDDAVLHAVRLIEEGADILDIGGESTRPGSAPVGVEEELRRVLPVVQALENKGIPISVDTSKPEVMRATIKAGATMINDINALQSPGALEVVADGDVTVCLMHMQGKPKYMQSDPQYKDVITEIKDFLQQRIEAVKAAGIAQERIVIDPGFGFGKALKHNLKLLRHLDQFTDMGMPILAGLSRKSMLREITGSKKDDLVYSSVSAALLAAINGAKILRVHDVKATKDALKIYNAVTSQT